METCPLWLHLQVQPRGQGQMQAAIGGVDAHLNSLVQAAVTVSRGEPQLSCRCPAWLRWLSYFGECAGVYHGRLSLSNLRSPIDHQTNQVSPKGVLEQFSSSLFHREAAIVLKAPNGSSTT